MRSVLVAVLGALVVATVAAGANPGTIKLTPVKSTFPERSFLLSLPSLGSGA